MAVSNYMRQTNEELIRWTGTLAIVAFVLSAAENALYLRIPDLAARYVQGDASTRATIEAGGLGSLDPNLILHSILLGLRFLSVNVIALPSRTLPRPLAWVGLIYGVGALFTIPFILLNLQVPLLVARGQGLIALSPIWFIGAGIVLRRT